VTILDELDLLADAMIDGVIAFYEHDAELFYQKTRQLAPGKSDAFPPTISDEERREMWWRFLDEQREKRGKGIKALVARVVELEAARSAACVRMKRLERSEQEALAVGAAFIERIAELEAALRDLTDSLGDHYCGGCGNGGGDVDQPYSDVTDLDAETCDGCRATVELLWSARAALDKIGDDE